MVCDERWQGGGWVGGWELRPGALEVFRAAVREATQELRPLGATSADHALVYFFLPYQDMLGAAALAGRSQGERSQDWGCELRGFRDIMKIC